MIRRLNLLLRKLKNSQTNFPFQTTNWDIWPADSRSQGRGVLGERREGFNLTKCQRSEIRTQKDGTRKLSLF